MIKDLIVSLKSLVFLNENSTVNVNGHKAIKNKQYNFCVLIFENVNVKSEKPNSIVRFTK